MSLYPTFNRKDVHNDYCNDTLYELKILFKNLKEVDVIEIIETYNKEEHMLRKQVSLRVSMFAVFMLGGSVFGYSVLKFNDRINFQRERTIVYFSSMNSCYFSLSQQFNTQLNEDFKRDFVEKIVSVSLKHLMIFQFKWIKLLTKKKYSEIRFLGGLCERIFKCYERLGICCFSYFLIVTGVYVFPMVINWGIDHFLLSLIN